MVAVAFYQLDLERFEGDITPFVFDIADINQANDYRLTVARDRAFKTIVFELDGVKDVASVTFTPSLADVDESNIRQLNPVTHFMVQELASGVPVEASGFGRIRWRLAPDA